MRLLKYIANLKVALVADVLTEKLICVFIKNVKNHLINESII